MLSKNHYQSEMQCAKLEIVGLEGRLLVLKETYRRASENRDIAEAKESGIDVAAAGQAGDADVDIQSEV